MSIERDQGFEQLEDIAAMMSENPGIEFENGKYVYYGLDGRTAFAAVYISGAWMAWQAQAVPDGFVLVNKRDLVKVLNCVTDDWLIDTDSFEEFKKIESLVQDEVNAMIEAQEQTND